MQVWLLIDGEKQGPFHDFEVRSKITHEGLQPDVLAWYESLDGWKPLSELALFEDSFETNSPEETDLTEEIEIVNEDNVRDYLKQLEKEDFGSTKSDSQDSTDSAESVEASEQPAPVSERKFTPEGEPILTLRDGTVGIYMLRRFFARSFDLLLIFVITHLFAVYSGKSLYDFYINGTLTTLLVLTWFLYEMFLTHSLGTTIGKALLGIRLESFTGQNLGIIRSILRSIVAVIVYLSCTMPLFALITLVMCYFFKNKRGILPWDIYGNSRVRALPMNNSRIIGFVLFGLTLLLACAFLTPPTAQQELIEVREFFQSQLKQ